MDSKKVKDATNFSILIKTGLYNVWYLVECKIAP